MRGPGPVGVTDGSPTHGTTRRWDAPAWVAWACPPPQCSPQNVGPGRVRAGHGGSPRSLADESDGWHDGARPDRGGPITAPCSTGWCGSTIQCLVGWARPVCRTNRTVGCDEPGPCGRTRPTRGFASRRLAWVSCVPAAAGVAAATEGASSRIRGPWRSGTITVPAAIVTQPPPRVPFPCPGQAWARVSGPTTCRRTSTSPSTLGGKKGR